MKPRLFWTMLLAFALVIVLGVCGMLGFFMLAISGFWQPQEITPLSADSVRARFVIDRVGAVSAAIFLPTYTYVSRISYRVATP